MTSCHNNHHLQQQQQSQFGLACEHYAVGGVLFSNSRNGGQLKLSSVAKWDLLMTDHRRAGAVEAATAEAETVSRNHKLAEQKQEPPWTTQASHSGHQWWPVWPH